MVNGFSAHLSIFVTYIFLSGTAWATVYTGAVGAHIVKLPTKNA